MKTAILGGSFDPVHIGHLHLADEVKRKFDYERIIFVPSNIPAHKEPEGTTSAEQRLEMLRYALQGSDFVLDDCEIRRGGISYSVDTVPELKENYRISGKPGLIIGDDLVAGLEQWKEWEKLIKMVDLLIARRVYRESVECTVPHTYLDNGILPISSSDIRKRVRSGGAFRYLLAEQVYGYIVENGVYVG